jgi:biopolymer transport protein ExbB
MTTPAAGAAAANSNPYGLMAALHQGGIIAQTIFAILVIMSVASWYIMFTKLFEQQKILNQAKRTRTVFWGAPTVRDGANKLDKNSAYRQIVDDGLLAQEQHTKLIDPVDQHEWLLGSSAAASSRSTTSSAPAWSVLATVGSTAPFVGLLGTVIGIYRALVKIGAAGQASIDAVAGPVGEALIMTAVGLVVAVPAVMGYNWLVRRNKLVAEQIGTFSTDLHGFMVSNGAVKPAIVSR